MSYPNVVGCSPDGSGLWISACATSKRGSERVPPTRMPPPPPVLGCPRRRYHLDAQKTVCLSDRQSVCSVLISSVLFCSVLFCPVLFCAVLCHSVMFCSVRFCYVPCCCSVLLCSVLFCSVCLVLSCSVLFCSDLRSLFALIWSVVVCSVLFCTGLLCSAQLICPDLACCGLFCSVLYFGLPTRENGADSIDAMGHGSCLALFDDSPPLWRGVGLPYRRGVFPRRGVAYFEYSRLSEFLEVQF